METVFYGDKPAPTGEETNASLELTESLIAPSNFASHKNETKKATLFHRTDFTLLLVNRKPQLSFKESSNTVHYPLSRRKTFHHNDEVICITYEAMATFFQLLVQIVEKNVGKKG